MVYIGLNNLGVSSVMIARGVGKDISLFGKKRVKSLFEMMKDYIHWVRFKQFSIVDLCRNPNFFNTTKIILGLIMSLILFCVF